MTSVPTVTRGLVASLSRIAFYVLVILFGYAMYQLGYAIIKVSMCLN